MGVAILLSTAMICVTAIVITRMVLGYLMLPKRTRTVETIRPVYVGRRKK